MAGGDTGLVAWLAFAALNAGLAVLVAGTRPRRLPHGVFVLLFGANALSALVNAWQEGGAPQPLAAKLVFVVEAPTFLGLLLLPFVVPRSLLGRTGTRLLFAGAAALVLYEWWVAWGAPGNPWTTAYWPTFLGLAVPFHFAVIIGVFVFLNERLYGANRIRREEAFFLLLAYVLKAGFHAGQFLNEAFTEGALLFFTDLRFVYLNGFWIPMTFVLVIAPPLALAISRWRGRAGARSRASDAWVAVVAVAGVAHGAFNLPAELEYLLARPLLLTYGFLQYRVLDLDVRTQRGVIGVVLVAAAVAVFVRSADTFTDVGLDATSALGLALGLLLAIVAAFAAPLARIAGAGTRADDVRRLDLYRASLERSLDARTDGEDAAALVALRARLGISEREHALLEAEAQAGRGGPEAGGVFLRRYRVSRPLGAGSHGAAYLARDETTGRDVVLKVARSPGRDEGEAHLREARALARVHHPNVVTVFDVETVGDDVVLVLEHVAGGALADRLTHGPLPLRDALAVADDLLAGLTAVHAEGIVHRDVKPENILLTRDGRAKLADFGIARDPAGSGTLGAGTDTETAGTLRTMAPEQVRGADVDARADVYAAAAVLYEALAGRTYVRFDGLLPMDQRLAVLDAPPRLPLANVPAHVNEALAAALAKDRAERPASAAALRARLHGSGTVP